MKAEKYCFLPENNRFSMEDFANPPADCAPIYAWLWNGEVSRAQTDRQLEEMKRIGEI